MVLQFTGMPTMMKVGRWVCDSALIALVLSIAASPASAFDVRTHSAVTTGALSFLKPAVRASMAYWNVDVDSSNGGPLHDTRTSHAWHFDNCLFEQAAQDIDTAYGNILLLLNPDAPEPELNALLATTWFGRLLHPVQDFYSHSNWVELGKAELFDDGLELWPALTPFSIVQGVKIVQGEHFEEPYLPQGITLGLADNHKVLVDGAYPGLISGFSGISPPFGIFGTDDDCPDEVTINHSTLNKDSADRPLHLEARHLARRQTLHEWCRLLNLVSDRYGSAGLRLLLDQWAADQSAALLACVFEPPASATSPHTVRYQVTVKTGDVDMAGADEANAFLMLQGTNDESEIISLRTLGADTLERGALDHYVARSYPSNLGEIKSVRIWYDSNEGWFLESVTVLNPETHQTWFFPCSKWLDSDSEGNYTERTLYPDHCE